MRIKRGKYLFTYKDCWSLDNTLSPIICAGLKKFKEELMKSSVKGHPMDFCNEDGDGSDEGFQQWLDTLDKMIYAFDVKEEPDIGDYDFTFTMDSKELPNGNFEMVSIEPTNKDEHNRYMKDLETWEEKCKEGRELFAEYFHNLWI